MTDRCHVIDAMIDAAFDAMHREARRHGATVDEVGSAGMTIALNTVVVLARLGADRRALRAAVERLLVECGDDRVVN